MAGWIDQVAAIMEKYGIPSHIWYPIMEAESGGNPEAEAITPDEDSIGLFQINLPVHPEYKNLNLRDPLVNAEVAARDFLAPAYKDLNSKPSMSPEDQTAYVWRYGIRPAWTDQKETMIKAKARDFIDNRMENPGYQMPKGTQTVTDKILGSLTPKAPVELPAILSKEWWAKKIDLMIMIVVGLVLTVAGVFLLSKQTQPVVVEMKGGETANA
jgi:hypothetical protein